MSVMSRMKQWFGGTSQTYSVAAAAALPIPAAASIVQLTGTASVTSLSLPAYERGRVVTFIQYDSGTTTFTQSAGVINLAGASNLALGQYDSVTLYIDPNGMATQIAAANN